MVVFTDSPGSGALFRSSRHLVGLTFYARIHSMVPAGGTVANHNNPGSEDSHLPLLHFKVFLAQADADVTLVSLTPFWKHTDSCNCMNINISGGLQTTAPPHPLGDSVKPHFLQNHPPPWASPDTFLLKELAVEFHPCPHLSALEACLPGKS